MSWFPRPCTVVDENRAVSPKSCQSNYGNIHYRIAMDATSTDHQIRTVIDDNSRRYGHHSRPQYHDHPSPSDRIHDVNARLLAWHPVIVRAPDNADCQYHRYVHIGMVLSVHPYIQSPHNPPESINPQW